LTLILTSIIIHNFFILVVIGGMMNIMDIAEGTTRACRKIELIHYDLRRPMPIPSANGNRYIVTFIYDYTRMCWVYLMKDKSQVFETFKIFHAWIQTEG